MLADLGVDVIVRNGFYETTDFWSPRQLERFLLPYLHERGVSGPMHLGEGTQEVARQAVRDAFGKRGLILSAVPSIRAHWPWENALATFDEWRRLRAFR